MSAGPDIARVRVEGRVQGVGFRAWTIRAAVRRGVKGWVRNRADGSVEALLAGQPEAVGRLLADLRIGPTAAEVSRIEPLPVDAETTRQAQSLDGFRQLPTE